MDAVEHIELVIFLRNLIHLGIIPQVDDPDLILFLQLQQLLHHLAVGGAVVLGARIEHHRAMPCGVGIYDDVFERAKDGFGVKVLQIAGTADFPQRDRVACIVGGKLADERIKLCVGVDIVQHPLDVGGLVVVGQCGAADSLFDIGAVVANGNVLRKGGFQRGSPLGHRGPQKAQIHTAQRAVLHRRHVFGAVDLGVAGQAFEVHRVQEAERPMAQKTLQSTISQR